MFGSMNIEKCKEEIAYYMQRLYNRALTTCSGGNISYRINEDFILVSPSGVDKGLLNASQICMSDMEGNLIEGNYNLSMETGMHIAIYKQRPDVNAVIHAHPPYATGFSASEHKINTALSGEMRALLGQPIVAKYACMGTKGLANNVAKACTNANVVLLENHGAIALGDNLFEAYDRMEVLEASAHISFIANMLGKAKVLNDTQLKEIDNFFKFYKEQKRK